MVVTEIFQSWIGGSRLLHIKPQSIRPSLHIHPTSSTVPTIPTMAKSIATATLTTAAAAVVVVAVAVKAVTVEAVAVVAAVD
jgi:hypothetical protein